MLSFQTIVLKGTLPSFNKSQHNHIRESLVSYAKDRFAAVESELARRCCTENMVYSLTWMQSDPQICLIVLFENQTAAMHNDKNLNSRFCLL